MCFLKRFISISSIAWRPEARSKGHFCVQVPVKPSVLHYELYLHLAYQGNMGGMPRVIVGLYLRREG